MHILNQGYRPYHLQMCQFILWFSVFFMESKKKTTAIWPTLPIVATRWRQTTPYRGKSSPAGLIPLANPTFSLMGISSSVLSLDAHQCVSRTY